MFKLISVRTAGVLLGAVALFAVVGFAASFAINGDEDIVNAEGETDVITCVPDVDVEKIDEWRDPLEFHPDTGGFYVKEIRVLNTGHLCAGKWITVVLTDENGNSIAQASAQVAAGFPAWNTTVIDFSGQDIPVWQLHDLHVLTSDQPPA